jgi:hypothetical protein
MVALLLVACPQGGPVRGKETGPGGVDSHESVDSTEQIPSESTEVVGETGEADEPLVPDVVVDCAGTGDYETITAAIAASSSGTVIGLKACTYAEDIDFIGKSLIIYGIDGASVTTIEGTGRGAVLTAARGEGPGTLLAGVTVTGGGGSYGSALYIDGAVLELEDLVITGNRQAYAVIYATGASLWLTDVSMEDNQASRGGMGIYADNGNLYLERFSMACGGEPYGIYAHTVTLMRRSAVSCPEAEYGIAVDGGELHARQSSVVGGTTGIHGEDNADTRNERLWLYNTSVVGGRMGVNVSYMHVKVDHSVLYGDELGLAMQACHLESYVTNTAMIGGACALRGDDQPYDVGWNAYGTGEACRVETYGDVFGDPKFVAAPDDFHLAEGSPLIDAGSPDADEEDADGSRSDVGVYGGPYGAW